MSTLIYIGANVGNSLSSFVNSYDSIHVFEPDPEMFDVLKDRFQSYSHVNLINAACSDKSGVTTFYVTPNRVSSSLGIVSTLTHDEDHPQREYREIQVNTINLLDYLKDNNIEHIDLYYSDAQGSDLNILKTISEYIEDKKIDELFIETHGNNKTLYDGLNNEFDGFKNLLIPNYHFVHASLGRLYGAIVSEAEIPEDEYEWDSLWRVNV